MPQAPDTSRRTRVGRRSRRWAVPIPVLASAFVLLSLAVLPAPARAAAPIHDELRSALLVTSSGGSHRIDTHSATTATTDPVPSCNGGRQADATVWYVVRTPRSGGRRVLHAQVKSYARGGVVTMYAMSPLAGAELVCTRTSAAGAGRALEHVLGAGMTYLVQIGSAGTGTGGDVLDITLTLRTTRWVATTPLAARRQAPAVTADGRFLYSFGGYQVSYVPGAQSGFHSEAVNRYDPATGLWAVIAQLPTGISYGQALRIGRRAYLPGGQSNTVNGAGCMTKVHQVLDLRTRVWATAASYDGPALFDYAAAADPARARYYMAGGAWDPTPCDFGAQVDDRQAAATARMFDIGTGTWTELPAMYNARQGATAHVVGTSGWLYVIGGLAGGQASGTVEAYDPDARRWYRGANMPTPVYGAAAGVGTTREGRPLIVVTGGWTSGGAAEVGVTQVYDVWANTWSTRTGSPATSRNSAGSAVVWGRLYAVGGWQRQPIRAAEWLRVDDFPPFARASASRSGRYVVLRARVSDSSGIASVTWRLPGGRRVRGTRVRVALAPGSVVRLGVLDRAGNATVRFVAT